MHVCYCYEYCSSVIVWQFDTLFRGRFYYSNLLFFKVKFYKPVMKCTTSFDLLQRYGVEPASSDVVLFELCESVREAITHNKSTHPVRKVFTLTFLLVLTHMEFTYLTHQVKLVTNILIYNI